MKLMVAVLIVLSCCTLAVADDNAREYQQPVVTRNDIPQEQTGAIKNNMHLAKVVLLTPQAELNKYTTDDEVVRFFKVVENKVTTTCNRYANVPPLVIIFDCKPNAYAYKITSQGLPPENLLDDLYDHMLGMPALKTTGPVSFQAEFDRSIN